MRNTGECRQWVVEDMQKTHGVNTKHLAVAKLPRATYFDPVKQIATPDKYSELVEEIESVYAEYGDGNAGKSRSKDTPWHKSPSPFRSRLAPPAQAVSAVASRKRHSAEHKPQRKSGVM